MGPISPKEIRTGVSWLVRTSRIALTAAIAALSLASTAQAADVGVVADVTWGQPRADVDREIELLQAAGVDWIRANVNWAGLEPDRKGAISAGQLADYDYAVGRARAAGLQVLMPISDGVPYWASSDPEKHVDAEGERRWNRFYQPANPADYGDIVRFVVDHFRAKGVHAYEIWNEPNHEWFWPSGPSPAAYVPLLKAGYVAAKAADSGSTVLLGGLAKSDFEYLEGVYRAGGGRYFDAVAVHPYTYGVDPAVSWNGVNPGEDLDRISKNAFPAIREIKKTMDAHGDGDKQVWITEFGFSTTTGTGGVSEAQQAAYLERAYAYVDRLPWVHSAFWFAARNNPFAGDRDAYEDQFGLFAADWRLKPSYQALREHASQGRNAGIATRLTTPERSAARRSLNVGAAGAAPRPSGRTNRLIVRLRDTLSGRVALRPASSWRVKWAARTGRRAVTVFRLTRRGWLPVVRLRTDAAGNFGASKARLGLGGSARLRVVARYGGALTSITVRSPVLVVRRQL